MTEFAAVVFALLGITITIAAVLNLRRTWSLNTWPAVEARVLERGVGETRVASSADPGARSVPRVRYSYSFAGKEYVSEKVWLEERSGSTAWARGIADSIPDRTRARVNPLNPQEAVLRSSSATWLWVAAAVGFLTFAGAIIAVLPQPMSVEDAKAWIEAGLPVGTKHEVATAWMRVREIENSGYLPETRTLQAKLRTPSLHWVQRTLLFELTFDADGRITAHEVREAFTGP